MHRTKLFRISSRMGTTLYPLSRRSPSVVGWVVVGWVLVAIYTILAVEDFSLRV